MCVCVYAYISKKSKRVSKNLNNIYVIKKQKQKTYLDFEAGLWNIGALIVRISRSSRVKNASRKHKKSKKFLCFQNPKNKKHPVAGTP